jgi:uncharacterized small protein (TIGR04563 family)
MSTRPFWQNGGGSGTAFPLQESSIAMNDKRKQSLYFPEEMLQEIAQEARRQDRSLSWVVQQAWHRARERVRQMPGVNDYVPQAKK